MESSGFYYHVPEIFVPITTGAARCDGIVHKSKRYVNTMKTS